MELTRREFTTGAILAIGATATGLTFPVLADDKTELFVKQIAKNVERQYESFRQFDMHSQMTGMESFILEMNKQITRKLAHKITSVADKPVYEFNGKTHELKTRRLSARMHIDSNNPDHRPEIDSALFPYLIDEIVAEFDQEFLNKPQQEFYPLQLAISSGIVLDPSTFEMVISFMTRYATA